MAVAEQTTSPATAKYTKTSSRLHSSQLSHSSTSPSFHFRRSFRPITRAQNFKITCSVNQVPAPFVVQTEEAKNKSERFGVFSQTYDLEAVILYTNGNPYGMAQDIVFSTHCRSKGDGDHEPVKDIKFDDYLLKRLAKTEAELLPEKRCVAHLTGEGVAFRDLPEDTMLPGEM